MRSRGPGLEQQLEDVGDYGRGAEPAGDEVRLPDPGRAPVHQHQDGKQNGKGGSFDSVGDELASGGHDRGHEAVELLVLEGEPQVGGEGVERLEPDQPTEDEGLAQLGAEGWARWHRDGGDRGEGGAQARAERDLSWERHRSYRFTKLCCAQPNETGPLPGRDRRELLAILQRWSGSSRIPPRT